MAEYEHRQERCIDTDDSNFNSSFDTGCLKFIYLDYIIASCFKSCLILAGSYITIDQMKKFYISQGSVVTFFGLGGQVYKN